MAATIKRGRSPFSENAERYTERATLQMSDPSGPARRRAVTPSLKIKRRETEAHFAGGTETMDEGATAPM